MAAAIVSTGPTHLCNNKILNDHSRNSESNHDAQIHFTQDHRCWQLSNDCQESTNLSGSGAVRDIKAIPGL